METFEEYFEERKSVYQEIGARKIKIPPLKDPARQHKFKMVRGANRKNQNQLPKKDTTHAPQPGDSDSITNQIKGMDISGEVVEVAKHANSGIWKISKAEVWDIAKKYKFNIPDDHKPIKHLGSTGIKMVRLQKKNKRTGELMKPVYYLFKGPKKKQKRRKHGTPSKGLPKIEMGF